MICSCHCWKGLVRISPLEKNIAWRTVLLALHWKLSMTLILSPIFQLLWQFPYAWYFYACLFSHVSGIIFKASLCYSSFFASHSVALNFYDFEEQKDTNTHVPNRYLMMSNLTNAGGGLHVLVPIAFSSLISQEITLSWNWCFSFSCISLYFSLHLSISLSTINVCFWMLQSDPVPEEQLRALPRCIFSHQCNSYASLVRIVNGNIIFKVYNVAYRMSVIVVWIYRILCKYSWNCVFI